MVQWFERIKSNRVQKGDFLALGNLEVGFKQSYVGKILAKLATY